MGVALPLLETRIDLSIWATSFRALLRAFAALFLVSIPCIHLLAQTTRQPNVVFLLADDIGYGDLGCYGSTCIATPNLDRLASQGMRFTDAHSPASVCTPTRYSLLTGQYAFRHKPAAGILSGIAPLSIPLDRDTLPKVFQRAGYKTGVVGKWHLGLGEKETDYNAPITAGPNQVGFDYSFIIPATGDRTPCVFVEDGKVVGYDSADPIHVSYSKKIGDEPTGKENPELLFNQSPSLGHDMTIVNGISRIGWMTGGQKARWKDEDIADTIANKGVQFIQENKDRNFFLYLATHDAHVPRVPHPRFRGKSKHGLRGDCIQEFDATVGTILDELDRAGIADNTLVIVSSDNGGVMDDGYVDGTADDASGHRCNGALRAYKGTLYEGGHRVPLIVRWPGRTPANQVSNELICHCDWMATLASVIHQKVDPSTLDSINMEDAILNPEPQSTSRTSMVQQGGYISGLAVRSGPWKLIPATAPTKRNPNGTVAQLFDLSKDLSETNNLAAQFPEKVIELQQMLDELTGE